MTDEQLNEPDDSQRVSRLSTTTPPAPTTPEAADDDGEAVVREYEQRYFPTPREARTRTRELPRSYSTLHVTEDEKLWAAVAHGSVWLTFILAMVTYGFLVPLTIFVPLVIYFLFRKRSDYVAFHSLQAFVLQLLGTVGALLVLVVGGTVWLIGFVIALLTMLIAIGFILVPLWGIVGIALGGAVGAMPLVMLLYGTMAAIESYNGRDYRYPYISRWVDRQLAGGLLNTTV